MSRDRGQIKKRFKSTSSQKEKKTQKCDQLFYKNYELRNFVEN